MSVTIYLNGICSNVNMSVINARKFATGELNELNILIDDIQSMPNFKDIVSWLRPTKTYSKCSFRNPNNFTSYQTILENIIDCVYFVLNLVLVKLEKLSGVPRNLCKPKRLTISSLSRIIIDNLSIVNLFEHKHIIARDVHVQTVLCQQGVHMPDDKCKSCIILFKELNNIISHTFSDVQFTNYENAKCKVRNSIFVLDNSQSMRIMCDAIHDDLRIFLDDYRALNESHAALELQYDKLMNDFIQYMAEYDASLTQYEAALNSLTEKVYVWHGSFASALQLLSESSTAIWEICENHERLLAVDQNKEANQLQQIDFAQSSLQMFARRLEQFNAFESSVAQTIVTSMDVCARKITLLQSRLRNLQVSAGNSKASNASSTENKTIVFKEHVAALVGNNPVEDMLQHIESNKLKIDYLQTENTTLQRTIERIKMRVTY